MSEPHFPPIPPQLHHLPTQQKEWMERWGMDCCKQTMRLALLFCTERVTGRMPVPCPDGIDGCCVDHTLPYERVRTAREITEALRKRLAEWEAS